MASRKAKPATKEKKRAADPPPSTRELRPSSSMTIEAPALTVEQLVAAARGKSVAHAPPVPPAPPTTARVLDDLAATVEVPALGAAGPRVLIMDAAEAVIADRGFNLTTSREVASWAGVSVDVFHAHFADMRALLGALCERLSAQATSVIDDATRPGVWDGKASARPVDLAIRSVVDLLLARAALVRAIFASGERALVDELRRVGTHLTVRLTRSLLETDDPPAAPEVGFAVLLAVSIAHHAIVVGPEWSGVELDRGDVSRRAAAAANAYLAGTLRSR
ncbi:MAG: helix-turn-helix transcriptional regulator [Labilithrix sp.]|nr:helix-turn-helix transcriptional regulator [Labilithrix sp.]MCW5813447.1 helix-turn-helix transcriptional regulator [Labilithrix sp.]